MNDSGFQYKVGLFVVVGVGLLALLVLNFSKGFTFLNPTYKLRVILPNAAGLKPSADVMMAGVPIGKVSSMSLAENERTVDIAITVLSKYKIRKDADIHIDSLGFLGDQYIEILPPPETGLAATNAIEYFQNGDTVTGTPVFNYTEAVKSISSVVDQAKKTMKDLDQAITNVNASALSANTLQRVVTAVSNIEVVSQKAAAAASRAENLLSADAPTLSTAVSNFEILSASLTNTAGELDGIVVANQPDIRRFVTNLTVTSDKIRLMADDLEAGKGLVGNLLKNDQMTADLSSTISNANALAAELRIFGSNLNQKGIWAMLWKPKHPKKDPPPRS
jgi:phospholipid/cholesterol/gamma-HCH transport system substrate-binding protein